MSEQAMLEVIRLWTGWFGQIVTLASGLALVLIGLREKLFPPNPRQVWLNGFSMVAIYVSFAGFLAAIITAVFGQWFLIQLVPGLDTDTEVVHRLGESTGATIWGFLAGVGGLFAYAVMNLSLHDSTSGQLEQPIEKQAKPKSKRTKRTKHRAVTEG